MLKQYKNDRGVTSSCLPQTPTSTSACAHKNTKTEAMQ